MLQSSWWLTGQGHKCLNDSFICVEQFLKKNGYFPLASENEKRRFGEVKIFQVSGEILWPLTHDHEVDNNKSVLM